MVFGGAVWGERRRSEIEKVGVELANKTLFESVVCPRESSRSIVDKNTHREPRGQDAVQELLFQEWGGCGDDEAQRNAVLQFEKEKDAVSASALQRDSHRLFLWVHGQEKKRLSGLYGKTRLLFTVDDYNCFD
ncbi:MAG: uncharacterized protein A8A55_1003 [Amphiamblys sp. WSBS2006]|nr:MAG: uncharacterized protein A8A55_1003 [Amphiamblys sp. WSBS2006]